MNKMGGTLLEGKPFFFPRRLGKIPGVAGKTIPGTGIVSTYESYDIIFSEKKKQVPPAHRNDDDALRRRRDAPERRRSSSHPPHPRPPSFLLPPRRPAATCDIRSIFAPAARHDARARDDDDDDDARCGMRRRAPIERLVDGDGG